MFVLIHPTVSKKTNKKHIKGSIQAAHAKVADKWASPTRNGKKRGKFQPATLGGGFAEAPAREAQRQGPGLPSSAAELLSRKRNLKYYQFKRKQARRMSFKCNHTAKALYSCTRQQP